MPVAQGQFKASKPLPGFEVLACDWKTNEIVAELPVRNLRFGDRLKDPRDWSFILSLGDPALSTFDVLDATQPWRRVVYFLFDGHPLGGGFVQGRAYSSTNQALSISGYQFIDYYGHQVINQTYRFDQVDQLTIARTLIEDITAQDGGDVNIILDGSTSSGVLRDRSYYDHEHKNTLEAVNQLSNVIDGFDYAITLRIGTNQLVEKVLELNYPRRGGVGPGLFRIFDLPGNIIDYDFPEDATGFLTRTHAIGAGEGEDMIHAHAENTPDILLERYPLIQDTYSYKDISHLNTLEEHAASDLDFRSQVFRTGTFKVRIDGDPPLWDYTVGDDARFLITDARFPTPPSGGAGHDETYRIIGWDCDATTGVVSLEAGGMFSR